MTVLSAAHLSRVLITAFTVAVSTSAMAVSVSYNQTFQTPANSGNAASDYTDFSAVLNNGSASVLSGVLHLTGAAPGGTQSDQLFTVPISPAPVSEITVFAQIGASNSNGNYNIGMVVGQNRLVFHPGFAAIPGAFRVEGPGGFGNTSMGFVPANGLLHQFEVHSFPSGLFTIRITDAGNPANVFTSSFTNIGSYGGEIGFVRSGPSGSGAGDFDGAYDNLVIVPEPASCGLLGLAGMVLLRRRR